MYGSSNQASVWVLLGGVLVSGAALPAQTITFRKIADTNTPIPGGTGTFTDLQAGFTIPAIGQGRVSFIGAGDGQLGVYTDVGGALRVVADLSTPIPGGTGNFTGLRGALNDGTHVAFRGNGSQGQAGIYLDTGGALSIVADVNTPVPGGTGTFTSFGLFDFDAGDVVFRGVSFPEVGLYTFVGGALSVVADRNTPIPGGTGSFLDYGPAISNGKVAFLGNGPNSQLGVYTNVGGALRVVADLNTLVPSGLGTFSIVSFPSLDNGRVVFNAARLPDENGVFMDTGGTLTTVYDETTPLPEGGGTFSFFVFPSISDGNITFRGGGSGTNAIYTNIGGSLMRVVGFDDALDGKTVGAVLWGQRASSGKELTFWTRFRDFSEGIFVATISVTCGDGVVDPGEACDDGPANSDTTSDACRTDCTLPGCGDGTVDTGEACDDGPANSDTTADACRTDCTPPRCGDGTVDAGEACDDAGESAECDGNCTFAECGDGTLNPLAGEQCDDGNATSGDGCSNACQVETGAVPTMSTWGLMLVALLLLTAAKICFGRTNRSANIES